MQCNYSVHSTNHRSQDSKNYIVKLFSKCIYILVCNIYAIIHLVTKCVVGGVLDNDAMVTIGQTNSICVRDAFSVRDVCFLNMLSHVFLQIILYLDVIAFFSLTMLKFVVLTFRL